MRIKRNVKDNARITSLDLGPLSVSLGDMGRSHCLHLSWRWRKWTYTLAAIILRFKKAEA